MHERIRAQPPSYVHGLVCISDYLPFTSLAQSAPFILVGSDSDTREALRASQGAFHFMNDVCCLGDDVLFCVGVDDEDAVIVSASWTDVLQKLRAVPDS